jgi:hypothetical protein
MKKTRTASSETITVNQLATLANLTPRRIRQLGDEGKIPKAENARLPMVESIKLLFQYYQRDSATLERERTLKTCAERKLRERELATLEGTLCDARVAQLAVIGVAKRYHSIVRAELERNEIKAITDFHASLGLPEDQRSALHAFHLTLARATIAKIEDVCEQIGRGQDPDEAKAKSDCERFERGEAPAQGG